MTKKDNKTNTILDNILEGCQIIDFDWKYIYLNRTAEQHNKRPNTELLGKRYMDMWPGITETEVFQKIKSCLEERKSYHLENEFKFSSGEKAWFDLSIQPIPEGVFILSIDITERKLSEIALQRSEQELQRAQEITHIGSWFLDIASNQVTWTEELYKMYGFDPTQPPPPYTEHMKLFTPESWEILSTSLAKTKETGIPYELELKTIRKDKSNGWMWVRGEAIIDKNNKITGLWGAAQDISERKNIELELQKAKEKAEESEARLQEAQTAAKIGNWQTNLSSLEVIWSPEIYRIFEVDPKSLKTSHPTFLEFVHPDDKERVDNSFFNSFNTDYYNYIDHRIITPNGNIKHIEERWKIIKDNTGKPVFAFGTCQDITERKNYEQEIVIAKEKAEESAYQVKAMFNSIPDLIFRLSSKGVFLDFKADIKDLYYTSEPIIGKNCEETLPPEIAKLTLEKINATLSTGEIQIYEYDLDMPFSTKKSYEARMVKSGKNEVTAIVRNVTDAKLKDLELIKAKEKAEESDRLKTAFLQNMSHEIRTPLNAIHGFADLLNNPELSEEKRKSFVQIIQNSSNQLISIVSDILTISALETRQEKLNISRVCINNVIVDLLAIFKQQANNQNISLYAKQQLNNKQSEIYTDKTKITQILSNLLSNALKFTHEGFIEFGYNYVEPDNSASFGTTIHELQFYVKDTGIGIKPEFHDKIFERFRQADKSINKLYGGTGLGLAISKAFVELLGGKISVSSEIDKGSVFYFTIPYKPVNENYKQTNPVTASNQSKTILVAEDEEYNFLYIEELLINMDFNLIHTKNGKETVDVFITNKNIDLILMDIKMPVMSGDEAAKIIKSLKSDLPIIAQSAYALEHELAKYENIFDDYITKPIKANELKQKVLKYLNINKNI